MEPAFGRFDVGAGLEGGMWSFWGDFGRIWGVFGGQMHFEYCLYKGEGDGMRCKPHPGYLNGTGFWAVRRGDEARVGVKWGRRSKMA
jgi:hypothetical protein